MENERSQRKIVAILAADVAGYSRLVETDEAGTLLAFKRHLTELIEPSIDENRGRLIKTMGDGVLAEFASAIDAILCARSIQETMEDRNAKVPEDKKFQFRIGLNVGDIVIDGDDIQGDGVNIAARLEGIAEPGEIYISGTVYDQLHGKLDLGFVELGEQYVKNLTRPIRTYRVTSVNDIPPRTRWNLSASKKAIVTFMILALMVSIIGLAWWQPWRSDVEPASVASMAFGLPDKPSIAVLPFTNMSEDKDQDYFAEGITEDIITDLSKISGLFVVARHSTFTYKDKVMKVSQIAEELGVRYVLEGSVRRSSDKLRITTQLSDVIKGKHLWAGRYDRNVTDVFAIQSDVAEKVVKAMAVTLKANELDRIYQRYTSNIDAYDAFVRARRIIDPPGRESIDAAQKLFRRAIELDPGFAGGYAGLSFSYSSKARLRLGTSPEEDARLSLEFAEKAIQVDRNFAWSHIALAGAYLAYGDTDAAVDAAQQAIQLQPGGYEENLFMGFYLTFSGKSALAIKYLEVAKRISPVDSVRGLAFLANAYFMSGDYAKSEELRLKRINNFPVRNPNPYVWLAATQTLLGKTEEASLTAAKLKRIRPNFRLSEWRYFDSYKSPENRVRLYKAALAAGLSE